jgi:CubicO group peptidase (beta-lactamase class C family)
MPSRSSSPPRPFTAAGFEPIAEMHRGIVAGGGSCAVAACYRGELVIDLWGGPGFCGDTLTGVYSVSKGIAAICVALLVQQGSLDLDAPVAGYWPEFAAGGKGVISVRVLLSHRAGLPGLVGDWSLDEILAHDEVAARLAAMTPLWEPGTAHGYHAVTIGVLIEELFRRITGAPLRVFYERHVGAPLGADFYLGLPAEMEPRVLPVEVPAQPARQHFPEHDYTALAFNSSPGFPDVPSLPRLRSVRAAGPVAFGGIGTARALARIYSACLDRTGAPGLLRPETVARMTALQASGPDLVLGKSTRYAVIFQKPDEQLPFGSWRAFGHDGAGGSLAFADPAQDLSFAYVTARFAGAGGPGRLPYGLLSQLRRCVRAVT